MADFDTYVEDYRDIINRVSSISGEQYEYFIQLRLSLLRERILDKAVQFSSMRILDFGCGTGATEIYLKSVFPGALVYGLDSSAESIRAAREMSLTDVNFILSEGLQLPFSDGFFDLIYSNGTYHHIDPVCHSALLQEMFRVCRKGGDLFIFENNPRNPLMMRAMKKNPFDDDATVVYPVQLRTIAANAGFDCREISYYFFFPRIVSALRCMEKWLRKVPLGAQYFLWATKEI